MILKCGQSPAYHPQHYPTVSPSEVPVRLDPKMAMTCGNEQVVSSVRSMSVSICCMSWPVPSRPSFATFRSAGFPKVKPVENDGLSAEDSYILAQTVDVVDFDSPALAAALNSGSDVRRLLVASFVVELRDYLTASLTLKATSKTCPSSIEASCLLRRRELKQAKLSF